MDYLKTSLEIANKHYDWLHKNFSKVQDKIQCISSRAYKELCQLLKIVEEKIIIAVKKDKEKKLF